MRQYWAGNRARAGLLVAGLGASWCAAVLFASLLGSSPSVPSVAQSDGAALRAETAYGKLPLAFEPNAGRTSSRVDYISRGSGYGLFLTGESAVMELNTSRDRTHVLSFDLLGTDRAAAPTGIGRLSGEINSYSGADPGRWRTGVPTFQRIRYPSIYPGIDVDWYGRRGALEHDFRIAPGADPDQITMRVNGAESMRLASNGDLLIEASGEILRQRAPVAYQSINGRRVPVASAYGVDAKDVSFRLGSYDYSRPLVIDPTTLVYSTFLGGSADDAGNDITVDNLGAAYVTGFTFSPDFPTTTGDQSHNGNMDAFVSKLSLNGGALAYSTFLGGTADEYGAGIDTADNPGEVLVAGQTFSSGVGTGFPTTDGTGGTTAAHDASANGGGDAFLSQLNPNGALTYSTYFGGSGDDAAAGVSNGDGTAYGAVIAGATQSANLPVQGSLGTFDNTLGGSRDAFVSTFAGGALAQSTYLGGSGDDEAAGVEAKLDSNYSLGPPGLPIHITGTTSDAATDFPTLGTGADTSHGNDGSGGTDAFLTTVEFLSAPSNPIWSSFLGGPGNENATDISVATNSDSFVTGTTTSPGTGFPTTPTAFEDTYAGGASDGYMAVFRASQLEDPFNPGSGIRYSSLIGGSGTDVAAGIAVDPVSQANGDSVDFLGDGMIVGQTDSADFPVSPTAVDTSLNGSVDAFATRLRANAYGDSNDDLIASTYLGGGGFDTAQGAAVDVSGRAYVTGSTQSAGFPFSPGALDFSLGGGQDAFVTKLLASASIDGSPLNIAVDERGHLTVSIDGESSIEFDADGNGPRAGLSLTSPSSGATGVWGGGGQFAPVTPPTLEVTGSTFKLTTQYVTALFFQPRLLVTETHTYVNGQSSFTTDYKVEMAQFSTPEPFRATIAADFNVDGEDEGVGNFDPGPPRFVGALTDPYQVGNGFEETHAWSAYEAGPMTSGIEGDISDPTGGLDNTVLEAPEHDNGAAVEWAEHNSAGTQFAGYDGNPGGPDEDTFQLRWTFRRVPPAIHGQKVVVRPAGGAVTVDAPTAAPIQLQDARRVPVGTEIDTRSGFVDLTAEQGDGTKDNATFWQGLFLAQQGAGPLDPFEASLSESLTCRGKKKKKKGKKSESNARASGSASAYVSAGSSRGLWAKGTGRFRTKGYKGSATVRGTEWLTTDRCKGKQRSTTFRLVSGILEIDDFSKKGTANKVLRRGSYTVPAAGKGKKKKKKK